MADKVVVNSLYTQSVYKNSFKFISFFNHSLPHVVYPCVDYQTIRSLAKYIEFYIFLNYVENMLPFQVNLRNVNILSLLIVMNIKKK